MAKGVVEAKKYTAREEAANSLTHLIGIVFALVATVVLLRHACTPLNWWAVVSFSLFGVGMMCSYSASTLYHHAKEPVLKAHLRKFDHAAIYFLIAGSYTPFTLLVLRNEGAWGWLIFGIVWACAAVGIALNFGRMKKNNNLKTASYIAMGWVVVFAIRPLIHTLSALGAMDVLYWMAAAGVFYTVGAVVYALAKHEFVHTAWHIMVLMGSVCLFVAALNIPL